MATAELESQRKQIQSRIDRLLAYFTTNRKKPPKDFHTQLTLRVSMDTSFQDFDHVQSQIELKDPTPVQTAIREQFETKYFQVRAEIQQYLDKQQKSGAKAKTADQSSNDSFRHIKLPEIKLPSFSGKYTDWLAFHDSFSSLVDQNPKLDEVGKLHYLKACLDGEAKHILDSINMAADNYETAWKILVDRFDNKRLIAQNHIHALYNLPAVQKDSAASLRQLHDAVQANLNALRSLGLPTDQWDALIIHLMTSKFDFFTKKDWEETLSVAEMPTIEDMWTFLNERHQLLEALAFNKTVTSSNKSPMANFKTKPPFRTSSNVAVDTTFECPSCKESHPIYKCAVFLGMDANRRREEIKRLNLCLNCLRSGHRANECRSGSCRHCSKTHNSLLHVNKPATPETSEKTVAAASEVTINTHCFQADENYQKQVLLSTAIVYVIDSKGKPQKMRALLDSGSQSNFITETAFKGLNIGSQQTRIAAVGIGQSQNLIKTTSKLTIKATHGKFERTISFLIIPNITGQVPHTRIKLPCLIPSDVRLADVEYDKPAPIDILVGGEIFWELLNKGVRELGPGLPSLRETGLGWILAGAFSTRAVTKNTACHLSTLEKQVARFWELESFENTVVKTADEKAAEMHFNNTYCRSSGGRFTVQLPFKTERAELGESKEYAMHRFKSLEKKFHKNPVYKQEYADVIEEYIALDHAEKVPPGEVDNSGNAYYLPHHGVVKEESTTTKLRVVFDASMKSSNKLSLNNNLLVGPRLQQDLFAILVRFRTHKVAFTSDINKMFRQIEVHPSHRDFLRFFWRFGEEQPIEILRMKSVTFGTASAPYLAVKCLQQAAKDESTQFPEASAIIMNDFYMDDLLSGASSIQEAKILKQQITDILHRGGFELRKWASNTAQLLPNSDNLGSAVIKLDKDGLSKTLGLWWNCQNDSFSYSIKMRQQTTFTKRTALSVIAQLFDPLGLIGPVVVAAKIVLQKIWAAQLEWDEPLPLDLLTPWSEFIENLPEISHIRIPRRICSIDNPIKYELHCFADASMSAYGACIYLKSINQESKSSVHLICAKSRVTPLKTTPTLPRLELAAALLSVRLGNVVSQSMNLKIDKITYWTDSKIVLAWLAASPHKWKTFVANRVAAIQEFSEATQWRHVSTKDNPADVLSRGCTPSRLREHELWWNGFTELQSNHENESQIMEPNEDDPELMAEMKTITCPNTIAEPTSDLLTRFSSFLRLVRVVSWMLRFSHNTKDPNHRRSGSLSVDEIRAAEIIIFKLTQAEAFQKETANLSKLRELSRDSRLRSLNPFADKHGILRVGGRLENATCGYDQKHQIILPHTHHVTNLIVIREHLRNLHAGQQATLAAIRQRFWIVSGRSLVRKLIQKCIRCFRTKPANLRQLMGQLPKVRTEPSRPFTNCGVDYAGPIQVKERGRGRRVSKAYVALFVCLATKAIHLELVSDGTTEAFLAALRRMIARRGNVANMYSDNAKNFVGADREIQTLLKSVSFGDVDQFLSKHKTTWHFIPPRSPHFGGLWEAGVKAVKHHLKRVTAHALLSFEEMHTLLCQIEACLNSRPLSPLSPDSNDPTPLTPGHFLVGGPLMALPENNLEHLPVNRLSHWQRVQQLTQHFWGRWSREYLHNLQQRTKWQCKGVNRLAPGVIVVLREDNLPPLTWRLGVITAVHPGRDRQVRVVTVRSGNGELKRSIQKICQLPIELATNTTV